MLFERSAFIATLAASITLMPMASVAQVACKPKGIDVCKMARQISDDTAKELPVQLNKNLSIQTVFAEGSTVTMIAKLAYTRDFLDQTLTTSGISNNQMIGVLQESARSAMCRQSSPTQNFVESGGGVSYIYRFNDGSIYTTITVKSCGKA